MDCKKIFILFTLVSQHLEECLAYNMCSIIFVDYIKPVEHKWRSSQAIVNAELGLLHDVNARQAYLLIRSHKIRCQGSVETKGRKLKREL